MRTIDELAKEAAAPVPARPPGRLAQVLHPGTLSALGLGAGLAQGAAEGDMAGGAARGLAYGGAAGLGGLAAKGVAERANFNARRSALQRQAKADRADVRQQHAGNVEKAVKVRDRHLGAIEAQRKAVADATAGGVPAALETQHRQALARLQEQAAAVGKAHAGHLEKADANAVLAGKALRGQRLDAARSTEGYNPQAHQAAGAAAGLGAAYGADTLLGQGMEAAGGIMGKESAAMEGASIVDILVKAAFELSKPFEAPGGAPGAGQQPPASARTRLGARRAGLPYQPQGASPSGGFGGTQQSPWSGQQHQPQGPWGGQGSSNSFNNPFGGGGYAGMRGAGGAFGNEGSQYADLGSRHSNWAANEQQRLAHAYSSGQISREAFQHNLNQIKAQQQQFSSRYQEAMNALKPDVMNGQQGGESSGAGGFWSSLWKGMTGGAGSGASSSSDDSASGGGGDWGGGSSKAPAAPAAPAQEPQTGGQIEEMPSVWQALASPFTGPISQVQNYKQSAARGGSLLDALVKEALGGMAAPPRPGPSMLAGRTPQAPPAAPPAKLSGPTHGPTTQKMPAAGGQATGNPQDKPKPLDLSKVQASGMAANVQQPGGVLQTLGRNPLSALAGGALALGGFGGLAHMLGGKDPVQQVTDEASDPAQDDPSMLGTIPPLPSEGDEKLELVPREHPGGGEEKKAMGAINAGRALAKPPAGPVVPRPAQPLQPAPNFTMPRPGPSSRPTVLEQPPSRLLEAKPQAQPSKQGPPPLPQQPAAAGEPKLTIVPPLPGKQPAGMNVPGTLASLIGGGTLLGAGVGLGRSMSGSPAEAAAPAAKPEEAKPAEKAKPEPKPEPKAEAPDGANPYKGRYGDHVPFAGRQPGMGWDGGEINLDAINRQVAKERSKSGAALALGWLDELDW